MQCMMVCVGLLSFLFGKLSYLATVAGGCCWCMHEGPALDGCPGQQRQLSLACPCSPCMCLRQFASKADKPPVEIYVADEWSRPEQAVVRYKMAAGFHRSSWDWIGLYRVGAWGLLGLEGVGSTAQHCGVPSELLPPTTDMGAWHGPVLCARSSPGKPWQLAAGFGPASGGSDPPVPSSSCSVGPTGSKAWHSWGAGGQGTAGWVQGSSWFPSARRGG